MYMNNTENIPINRDVEIRCNSAYTIMCCWLVDTFSFLDLINQFILVTVLNHPTPSLTKTKTLIITSYQKTKLSFYLWNSIP